MQAPKETKWEFLCTTLVPILAFCEDSPSVGQVGESPATSHFSLLTNHFGCGLPRCDLSRLVAVLVVLPGLHERGAGSRIRLGLLSALWHATPPAKPRAFKFTPSTCGNNARNSMATTDDFSLLDRAVSNYL